MLRAQQYAEVLAEDGVSSDDIGAISFSGQMHGSVLLDEKDDVLRPALLWCDQRTAKQCEEITEKVGGRRLDRAYFESRRYRIYIAQIALGPRE